MHGFIEHNLFSKKILCEFFCAYVLALIPETNQASFIDEIDEHENSGLAGI